MKEPKRYECTQCGFISNRTKSLKFDWVTFAICFKCRGRLKERQEWCDWLHDQQRRIKQQAIEHGNGYLLGVDILTPEERKKKESGRTAPEPTEPLSEAEADPCLHD